MQYDCKYTFINSVWFTINGGQVWKSSFRCKYILVKTFFSNRFQTLRHDQKWKQHFCIFFCRTITIISVWINCIYACIDRYTWSNNCATLNFVLSWLNLYIRKKSQILARFLVQIFIFCFKGFVLQPHKQFERMYDHLKNFQYKWYFVYAAIMLCKLTGFSIPDRKSVV